MIIIIISIIINTIIIIVVGAGYGVMLDRKLTSHRNTTDPPISNSFYATFKSVIAAAMVFTFDVHNDFNLR